LATVSLNTHVRRVTCFSPLSMAPRTGRRRDGPVAVLAAYLPPNALYSSLFWYPFLDSRCYGTFIGRTSKNLQEKIA